LEGSIPSPLRLALLDRAVMPDAGQPHGFNAAADPVTYERASLAAVRTAVGNAASMSRIAMSLSM